VIRGGKKLAARAAVVRAIRAFFDARGFLEVDTPLVVPSPGLDLHLDAFALEGSPLYLTTSPEYQMKRLLADGYDRIYQIGKSFRRGELGAHHNPEFAILEWYRTQAGADDVMKDTEQLVAAVTGGEVVVEGQRFATSPPYERITVCEAFLRFAAIPPEETLRIASEDEDRFFRAYVDAVEPALARIPRAVFLTEWPAPMASLARKKPGDPRVAERFELYVAGLELCNGFGELVDPVEQRARFEADRAERARRGLPVYPIDEKFVAALARGVPPSGGNALGVDRLVALAAAAGAIGEVMAFAFDEL
jgi:lysyl-tRNA synthetase class 2